MGRGNALVFGKISLTSETETMEKLITYLDKLIVKHGYPSDKVEESPQVKKLEDELMEALNGKEVPSSGEVESGTGKV